MPSQIEWTDETWNPVRGCAVVSAGCTNCYAMKQAHRFSGHGGPYEGLTQLPKAGPVWTGKIRLVPELLDRPLRWRRPRRVFVNSMSDLFHPDVPEHFIDRVFAAMSLSPLHQFQVLTKRPERMRSYLSRGNDLLDGIGFAEMELYEQVGALPAGTFHGPTHLRMPLPNVWLGVSVENQATADERIPILLDTPAAVRWISAEPLLGEIDLATIDLGNLVYLNALTAGVIAYHDGGMALPVYEALDWVVAGGESGSGARPAHPDWFRQLRDQCAHAGIPFFFKQWGAWAPAPPFQPATHGIFPDGSVYRAGHCMGASTKEARRIAQRHAGEEWERLWKPGKKAAGRELDGEIWDQMPDFFRHSSGTVGDR